jgi:hypothetical protein
MLAVQHNLPNVLPLQLTVQCPVSSARCKPAILAVLPLLLTVQCQVSSIRCNVLPLLLTV